MFYLKCSPKSAEFLSIAVTIIMYIALCAETDMYVPAFPEMVSYFSTQEDMIQLILSINFLGLCIAGLVCGPISDIFGRRKVLLIGLLAFTLSSFGCACAKNLSSLLILRFIQGFTAGIPMVVGTTILLDKYETQKASKLIGIINSVITAGMGLAPIFGTWLSNYYGWRSNFIFITILAFISLVGAYFFIEESLTRKQLKKFNFASILNTYALLSTDWRFIGYSMISILPLVGVVIYISNLSLIFINHLHIPLEVYGYYQASTMCSFLVFSALSSKFISSKGLNYTKNLGFLISMIGAAGLMLTAIFNPDSALQISIFMIIFAAGGALMVGIFGMRAIELHPDKKGPSSSIQTVLRQLLACGLVIISEVTFNGTIVPVAKILFLYSFVSFIWFLMLEGYLYKNRASSIKIESE